MELPQADYAENMFLRDVPVGPSFYLTFATSFRGLLQPGLDLLGRLPRTIAAPLVKIGALPTVRSYGEVDQITVDDALAANPKVASAILTGLQRCNLLSGDIKCPGNCVIARGENDLVVSRKDGVALANRIGAAFLEFKGVSHTPHLEVEAEFNRTVLTFLENPGEFVSALNNTSP